MYQDTIVPPADKFFLELVYQQKHTPAMMWILVFKKQLEHFQAVEGKNQGDKA